MWSDCLWGVGALHVAVDVVQRVVVPHQEAYVDFGMLDMLEASVKSVNVFLNLN